MRVHVRHPPLPAPDVTGNTTPGAAPAALWRFSSLTLVRVSAHDLPIDLRRALVAAARTPRLLVATDYDGTLAPIVADPGQAYPRADAVRALRGLAALPSTSAAVISGRSLKDLAALSRLPIEVKLVGSHGSEFDIGFINEIDPEAKQLLTVLVDGLASVADKFEGVHIETKPASVALHVRNASAEDAERALEIVRGDLALRPGVQVTEGKSVIELSVVATDKGAALDLIRHQDAATAAVFFGDDVTDEKAFASLHGPDVGVKVGDGDTAAEYRVDTTEDVNSALALLLEERRTWLSGANAAPIERLTMLASPRSKALVTPDGTITWMCHPEPDSAALFAHLLGGEPAGHFTIGPTRESLPLSQRYVDSHDDCRHPLGCPRRHRLPAARRRAGPNRPHPRDHRPRDRTGDLRAASRVRTGTGDLGGHGRRNPGDGFQRALRAPVPRRALGHQHRRRAPVGARRRGPLPGGRRARTSLRYRRSERASGAPRGAPRPGRSVLEHVGEQPRTAAAQAGSDEALGSDPARPRPRADRVDPRSGHHVACPRRSAGSATGTTATAGCGMRR